ncbi:prephenate dehydrogenase dimerization domain-containing protein [Actinoplanes siamensis]|uniref:Prephenate/arogenate dehydrogenase domain-containing protein n=1 Tax=Actinoplanes siamensis TaxID=1223317 RepID=A0A919NEE2_9ACTN|nr:prephenate dehydrogenase dimerization domain-containing protein [Actinoplanes siamensis]GIF09363.1 hypothetical protein Asi03nite_69010 [Actinoplanes siamensis]
MGDLRRAVVLGGAGAVGSMMKRLLQAAGATVQVADVAPDACLPGDVTTPSAALLAALTHADCVVVALHERIAVPAITALSPHLAPDAVLVETASVKQHLAAAVRTHVRGSALGINPLFAPDLSPSGRNLAAVVHRPGEGVGTVLDLLRATGTRVIVTDADEHDRAMAAVQVATHASLLAFGRAVSRLGVDAGRLGALATPPYATLMALLARIIGGEPAVYQEIQTLNGYGRAARAELADALRVLAADVEAGDDTAFGTGLKDIDAFLGEEAALAREHCARLFAVTREHTRRR